MLGKGIRQTMFGHLRKGTQQQAGADKGRLKGYIFHPSAVKKIVNHFVSYANFGQTFLLL